MQHKIIRGKIKYISKKPEQFDLERGREEFLFTRHKDGKVTFRARCEIEEPQPSVHRDIIYSLDENNRPMDCHVRLTVGDNFMGSGWFHFGDGFVECESFGPAIGRLSQRVTTNGHFDGFGTHPIVGDAYLTRAMDISRGPHRREMRVFLPSADHRGATPPMISEVRIWLEYVGEENKSTAAGNFRCRHFRFVDEGAMGGKQHPPYDMWVTADENSLFVCGGVGGYMQTWYELVELAKD
jgi:hypothetical protein